MPRLSKIGAAALAAFGWTGLSTVSASYLVVAGGGSGAVSGANTNVSGGGGGAGGLLSGTTTLSTTASYTVTVGAGGANVSSSSANISGNAGSNSVFNSVTATGGGYGAAYAGAGGSGGSGGGGGAFGSVGTGTSGQGNSGGSGFNGGSPYPGGGGGGAGAVGANATISQAGAGGVGTTSSISGTSTYYAGGGGSGGTSGGAAAGAGGNGGGGAGGAAAGNGTSGTANTGGGGGASGGAGGTISSGNGGSGIVIISYLAPQKFGGGIITTSGGNIIHTFTTSGTLSPLSSLSASYLVVAGGAGGGNNGAGGGAGGLLTGSSLTIDSNSTYLVTVGSGGAGSSSNSSVGSSGTSSTFSMITTTASGGGGGASGLSAVGASGGSGGGGWNGSAGGSGTVGQGNNGGTGSSTGGSGSGGGGGGAGAVGANASGGTPGAGGVGVLFTPTGSYYAGGGGSLGVNTAGSAGGNGGGGAGATHPGGTPVAGTANTGGGGGGGSTAGANGGSGIVIIAYAGSTQQMAGGTVTITGGYVIHTFTSSGYLTPLTYVNRSLRFRSSNSANLTRTFGTPTDNKKWTFSAWVKRGVIGTSGVIICTGTPSSGNYFMADFATDSLDMLQVTGGSVVGRITSTAVYRDPAAWYHVVFVWDSANATATNRMLMYVNGVQITSFSTQTNPSLNLACSFNTAATNAIGYRIYNADIYFDGYMSNIHFIDGQALTPYSFGAFNSYGVWQPINYGGSYGNNGCKLTFSDNTSTTTLGYDTSPNGNNWTTSGITLTTGGTGYEYDSVTDVPTLTSSTAANFATLNPLIPASQNPGTYTRGNLRVTTTPSAQQYGYITMPAEGKIYFEVTPSNVFADTSNYVGAYSVASGGYTRYYSTSGQIYNGSSWSAYGSSWVGGVVVGVAVDTTAGSIEFFRNNVSQGAITGLATGPVNLFSSSYISGGAAVMNWNLGQQPFTYTPPSGYVTLNTYNM